MKIQLLLLTLILSTKLLFGQEYSKWNASVNVSTSFSGILIAPAVNLEIGRKTEISILPIYRYYKPTDNYKDVNLGFQFSGKYYLSKENKMDPYISGLTGYLKEKSMSGNTEPKYFDYFTFGVLLGNEINIGQTGWNFDFNIGLINSQPLNYSSSLNIFPAYSIGIKKRFTKK
jgi:hypothetical protein